MWLGLLAAIAGPLPSVPTPQSATIGAVCSFSLFFSEGEQSRIDVPSVCPEPFRSAIRDHFEHHPLPQPSPAEHLDLRATFLPTYRASITEPLASDPSPLARPREGTHLHLPEALVVYKRQRWPKTPPGLMQPVHCRALLDFDRSGRLSKVNVRACPPELAALTQDAVELWRVAPTYLGVDVLIRTQVSFTYGPS